MSIYSQFKTSKVLEEEGIKVKFAANDDGSIPCFTIGRASRSNVKWTKTFEAKTRPFKDGNTINGLSDQDASALDIDIFTSALLYGWENIQGKDNKNIEFSIENAKKLFLELPELYRILDAKSHDMKNFLEVNLKEDEKN